MRSHWKITEQRNKVNVKLGNARARKHRENVREYHAHLAELKLRQELREWADQLYSDLRYAMWARLINLQVLHNVLMQRLYQLRIREQMTLGEKLNDECCILCGGRIHVSDFAACNYVSIAVNNKNTVVHRVCPNELKGVEINHE